MPLYFYCNLIRELLHVLSINPKGLEVHPLGYMPGHSTIFELHLFYVVRVSIYPKSFVCLFVLFIPSLFLFIFLVWNNTDLRPNIPEVTIGSRGYKQARVKR